MISEAKFYGGSTEVTSAVDITAYHSVARLYIVSMTTASKKVKLEDARNFPRPGGPCFFVDNRGANSFAVADLAGTSLATVPTGSVATVLLQDNTTANGTWRVRVKARL